MGRVESDGRLDVLGAADEGERDEVHAGGLAVAHSVHNGLTAAAYLAAAYLIQRTYNIDQIAVPFVGKVGIDPTIFVIFAAFAIIAASNGVNITDGLDGLAGGTLVFAFVAFLLVSLLNIPAQPNLAFLCALIIGVTVPSGTNTW